MNGTLSSTLAAWGRSPRGGQWPSLNWGGTVMYALGAEYEEEYPHEGNDHDATLELLPAGHPHRLLQSI